jgi:hypothetical protein
MSKKSSKPASCQLCGSTDLARKITTYPVALSLAGKQINVGRVALHECSACGHLSPTSAGQAKIDRCVDMGVRLFLGQLLIGQPLNLSYIRMLTGRTRLMNLVKPIAGTLVWSGAGR